MVAPTLTANQTGNPFVEVFFPSYPAGTASVRIERLSENRVWPVRGGINISPGVAVLDFEVPFQTSAAYRAEVFNSVGASLGYTESAEIIVNESRTIVHQPLAPQLWTPVRKLAGTASTITRPSEADLTRVEGSGIPKVIGTNRHGVEDMPFVMHVDNEADADTLQDMLGAYETQQIPVLCIRTPGPMRIPRTFFAYVPELPERRISSLSTDFEFTFSATEVQPPFPGLSTPLLTYDDLDAAFATYTALDAAFSTYTDRDRAYYLAGTA